MKPGDHVLLITPYPSLDLKFGDRGIVMIDQGSYLIVSFGIKTVAILHHDVIAAPHSVKIEIPQKPDVIPHQVKEQKFVDKDAMWKAIRSSST